MYQFAKDFASPIVTFIAAGVAGYITFTFARIQAGIATSQRDIALDKLKFDLFHNRYEIYENVKQLIEYILFVVDTEKIDFVKNTLVLCEDGRGSFLFSIRYLRRTGRSSETM